MEPKVKKRVLSASLMKFRVVTYDASLSSRNPLMPDFAAGSDSKTEPFAAVVM